MRTRNQTKLLLIFTPLFFAMQASAAKPPEDDAASDAKAIVKGLSLESKIGQMIQAEILNVNEQMDQGKHPIRDLGLGSVLAGGNSIIPANTVQGWNEAITRFKDDAAASATALPLLVGVDAVHGHGILRGATVFPHQIGLGAARNPQLMEQIGAAVAGEVLETGFNWTFAPGVMVARDARWGRSYESFGETAELQALLVAPYVRGLQGPALDGIHMSATAKHFIGDGATEWGTGVPSSEGDPQIDQGDVRLDLKSLIAVHGEGYRQAIAADVATVMISYSSVSGVKMHGHKALIMNYLKAPATSTFEGARGLGFKGFVISDWNAIDSLDVGAEAAGLDRYKKQLVLSVNSGIDMLMVEGRLLLNGAGDEKFRFERAHQLLLEAVRDGSITTARIDDAVERIVRAKIKAGLIEAGTDGTATVRTLPPETPSVTEENQQLARQAARESLVLLKNQGYALPITAKRYKTLCVAGAKADDFGVQVGGWTMGWQGNVGNATKTAGSATILEGIRSAAKLKGIRVVYEAAGTFTDRDCKAGKNSLTLVVVGENPYAEFLGDRSDLSLATEELDVLGKARKNSGALAVVVVSGRPLIVTNSLSQIQALVAAWLPGSQGEAVADVLFGDHDFVGRLPVTWPVSMQQLPANAKQQGLFAYGFGLSYGL